MIVIQVLILPQAGNRGHNLICTQISQDCQTFYNLFLFMSETALPRTVSQGTKVLTEIWLTPLTILVLKSTHRTLLLHLAYASIPYICQN